MSTWYEDVEDIVKNKIMKDCRSLSDVYSYKEWLQGKYPDNNFVEDKIRRTRLDSSSRSSEMLVSLLFSGMGNIRSYDFWEITPEDFFRVFIFFAAVAYCMDK